MNLHTKTLRGMLTLQSSSLSMSMITFFRGSQALVGVQSLYKLA